MQKPHVLKKASTSPKQTTQHPQKESSSRLTENTTAFRTMKSSEHFFFLSGCCMAQRKSSSGRSPFCQQKLRRKSQIHWKSVSAKATYLKHKNNECQPQSSLPESAGAGGWYCHSATTHCIGLWLFLADDVVRAGDCSLPWEPELVSPFSAGRVWPLSQISRRIDKPSKKWIKRSSGVCWTCCFTGRSRPRDLHRVLLATRSFLSSPITNFDPTDFCHLRRRSNLLICLFCNFWPEWLRYSVLLQVQLRPIADHDMLTVGRSARDLLRKKIAL